MLGSRVPDSVLLCTNRKGVLSIAPLKSEPSQDLNLFDCRSVALCTDCDCHVDNALSCVARDALTQC